MQPRVLNSGTVIGAVLTCLGVAAVVASLAINKDADGGWGARIFPLIGAGALVILGVLEFRKGYLSPPQVSGEAAPMKRMLALLAVSLVYVWLIGKFGYLISTGGTAILTLMIFGVRNPVALGIAAILCPAIYHVIFFVMLGVFPPYGEWFDLLDVIQGY